MHFDQHVCKRECNNILFHCDAEHDMNAIAFNVNYFESNLKFL